MASAAAISLQSPASRLVSSRCEGCVKRAVEVDLQCRRQKAFGGRATLRVQQKPSGSTGVVMMAGKGFGPQSPSQDKSKKSKAAAPVTPSEEEDLDKEFGPADDAYPSSLGEVPQVVTDRMLTRILVLTGIPAFLGFGTFPLFYYLQKVQGIDIAPSVAFVTSGFAFAVAAAGISYGVLSASWDPNREGSLLGWTEARANLPVLLDTWRRGGRR